MANAAIGSLVVMLALDSEEYTSGLTKAEYRAQQFSNTLTSSMKSAAGAIASYLSVDAVVHFTESLINAQEQLSLMAEKTGIAVQSLGGIGMAAEKSGMGLEQAGMMISRLGVNLARASEGSGTAKKALDAMGLSSKELVAIPVEEAFLKIVDKINSYADGSKKNILVQELFNRSFQQMIPLLNMGSGAIRDNIEFFKEHGGVTDESAKKARAFNDTLIELKTVATGLTQGVLNTLMIQLKGVADALLDMTKKADKDTMGPWSAGISLVFEVITIGAISVTAALERAAQAAASLAAQAMAKTPEGQRDIILADNAKATESYNKLKAAILGVQEAGAKARGTYVPPPEALNPDRGNYDSRHYPGPIGIVKPPAPGGAGAGAGRHAPGTTTAEAYLAMLEKEEQHLEKMTPLEKLNDDLENHRITGLNPERLRKLELEAMYLTAEEMHTEEVKKAAEAELERNEALEKTIEAELKQIEAMEKSNDDLQKQIDLVGKNAVESAAIENAYLDQTIALDKMNLARMATKEGFDQEYMDLEREIKALEKRQSLTTIKADWETFNDPEKQVKDMAAKTEQTMSESLANGIMEGFRQGHSFADVFLNELKAQFAKTILTPMLKPIVEAGNDWITKIMGGILGAISPGGGSLGGTGYQFSSTDLGGSASSPGLFDTIGYGESGGGPVSAGSLSRVNELRTEGLNLNGQQFLLMGAQGGNIDNNPGLGKAGGGVNITQVLHVGDGVSRNDLASAMVFAKEQAKAEIMRSMRTGGAFART